MLWALLTSKAAGPMGLVLAVAAALFAGAQSVKLADAQGQVSRAQAETQTVRLSITQTDTGWAARLGACNGALEAQGAALTAAAAVGSEKAQTAASGLANARAAADLLRAKATTLQAPTGSDELARWQAADRIVAGALQ